jgi:CRP-like cAMP-binding protein
MFEVFQKYISDKIVISEQEYELIKSVCIFKKLRKRQYLLQDGDVWKYNAFVCKGCLRNYRLDENGTEHVLSFSKENWWTGDRESLHSGKPSVDNIDALEDTVVLLINKEDFEMICARIPAFNNMVQTILNNSFIASQNRIHSVISLDAEQKYKNFMEKYPDLTYRVPQHMIASYLGITPETLSRVRKEIAKD